MKNQNRVKFSATAHSAKLSINVVLVPCAMVPAIAPVSCERTSCLNGTFEHKLIELQSQDDTFQSV